ncbi:MAG TPA: glycosyltransferase family 39 protein [Bryobacteraceae bacterium]|nr:glycosyltransferase family 39 protein [Bryobacteraceae bacterium]
MPAASHTIQRERRLLESGRAAAILLVSFSLLYFADICLRASAKYFWFDELVTLYVCRLPNLHAVFQATLLGADYNPPLFHILTRLAQSLFGDGLIATRVPSILGVWTLCVCLFAMVSKRSGPAAGSVAMLLPLLTSTRYYAYEARSTGIVLGLAGLAALAWQRLAESRQRKAWLGLFGASLLAAFLTHCYAITLLFPFGCAEAFRSWRRGRLDRSPWVMMGCAALVTLVFYVPLLHAFERHVSPGFFPPGWGSLDWFYDALLAPAILPLVACLALFAADRAAAPGDTRVVVPGADIVLALGFLALPVAGLLLAVVIHGPFIARYWFPAIVGVCLAAGYASRGRAKWMAPSLAVLLALLVTGDFARLVRHRLQGVGEALVEPNTLLPMNTTPGQPLRAYDALWSNTPGDAPIMVTDGLEYAFLAHYVAPQVRSRLWYYMVNATDPVGSLLLSLEACCQLRYNVAYAQDFARANSHYYVYGKSEEALAALRRAGGPAVHTRFRTFLRDRVVVEFTRDE